MINTQGYKKYHYIYLTNISLVSFLWDIGKQHSPRWDAAERGVPSGAILFQYFIEKRDKKNNIKKKNPNTPKMKVYPNDNDWRILHQIWVNYDRERQNDGVIKGVDCKE